MGELDSGQFDILTIHCSSDSFGYFNEQLVFLVTESFPADEENRQVSLVANVCPPNIDFKNYSEIFNECHVVDSFNQFIYSTEVTEIFKFKVIINFLYNSIINKITYVL
jgi:hypothetical protein